MTSPSKKIRTAALTFASRPVQGKTIAFCTGCVSSTVNREIRMTMKRMKKRTINQCELRRVIFNLYTQTKRGARAPPGFAVGAKQPRRLPFLAPHRDKARNRHECGEYDHRPFGERGDGSGSDWHVERVGDRTRLGLTGRD